MFVQVLEGKVRDVDGLRAQLEAWRSDLQAGADGWLGTTAGITEVLPIADELAATLRRMRPDVIGTPAAWPGDGTIIQTVYFTSERDARAGESAEPMSDEDRAASERVSSLMQMERFVDLPDPWLYSR